MSASCVLGGWEELEWRTQKVLEPELADGGVFEDDFCAYDMRLPGLISCNSSQSSN